MNKMLFVAAVLGLTAVALGAYVDHGLRGVIDDRAVRSVMTALRYQQFHAVLVVAIGLALVTGIPEKVKSRLRLAGWVLVAGVVLFAGSIYLAKIGGLAGVVALTPVGGITIMAGWLLLAWAALTRR